MHLDPELIAETAEWLLKAANDLRAADLLQKADPPLFDDVVFHCQQAAEKALKAFLTWHQQIFRKTHSLEEVGEQCLGIDPTLKDIVDRVVPLTEYAWKFRYPGQVGSPTVEEAAEAITAAREAYQAIQRRLPGEVQPKPSSPSTQNSGQSSTIADSADE